MAVDAGIRVLEFPHTSSTETTKSLGNATRQARAQGLEDYFVVDLDAPRDMTSSWNQVLTYYEDEVMVHNTVTMYGENTHRTRRGRTRVPYVNEAFTTGYDLHDLFGRIPHHDLPGEPLGEGGVDPAVEYSRHTMDALGIDVQVVFPSTLVNLGRSQVADGEAQVAYAFNRWFSERICSEEPRLKFFAYLPMRRPEMCDRIIKELAGKPGLIGFLITTLRYDRLHANQYMPLYSQIEELGYPIAFHGGPSWEEPWMRTMNRLLTVDAISSGHPNMVHLSNWIINGLPERFPNLKTIWMQGGIAWIPYLMQRLDSYYMKRTAEAPLLTRLPSEYMTEMYYGSQPLERENQRLLQATLEEIHADTQLLYASAWPQWDFDPPSTILDIPFLSDEAKRNILGETARKLFNL